MTARTHDLLRLTDPAAVVPAAAPPWVAEALEAVPWVVVRRGAAPNGHLAVGVRGPERHQRHAAWVRAGDVRCVVRPEQLRPPDDPGRDRTPALAALRAIGPVLDGSGPAWSPTGGNGLDLNPTGGNGLDLNATGGTGHDLNASGSAGPGWGPTGSAGFELATGHPTTTDASDLDVIIRRDTIPTAVWAAELRDRLPAGVDCLIETPAGGVALAELAAGPATVALRTGDGPRLVRAP
ncbi:phosphoribosyl-dephospho-CoA transferase MdcG domain-containing protein [Dactylosporangium sp. NPDC005555]|uniref:phosphoribosyl-dephospho-CoA transferase MdcG domain-containing protein n=1 Tax=Dactylosporangium sp. NPDC005555 TaxID=3154889 RepID=UPI0033ADB8C6